MVSIPCSSTVPFPTKLPLFNKTLTSTTTTTSSTHHFPFFRSPCHHAFHHRLPAISRPFISNAFSSDQDRDSSGGYQKQMRTLFPGGFKRPEIKVPTVVLRVDAEEILGNEESRAAVDQAVSKLFVEIVLLSCNGGDGGGGGGRFYQAACALKELIRDRAYLVIEDRVDIASAVGASGILLSDQGLPAIIARNMMLKSMPKSVLLPLVARTVQTMDDAASASSSDGTDFLIVGTTSKNYCNELEKFMLFQDIKIPIFLSVIDTGGDYSLLGIASKILESGASGLVLSVDDLKLFGGDMFKLFESVDGLEQRMQNGMPYCNNLEITEVKRASSQKKLVAGFNKLADMEIQFIEAERQALLEAVGIIGKAAPLMKEASLLVDAIARLDQPFLLAIVGEFNSGKSSVINALLGRKFLKEGVVPTTNEITLLCHSDTDSVEQERCERHPDGQFICYVPAPILKEMNIVDTPGTNVILQRQQRLTEEFIPRADLVLFVLSSDRPLTESEVQFLLYVREWKKNVIFALNKSDLYRSTSELEEAIAFIKENVRKLLMTEHVILFPVSARSALEAKLSASSYIEADYNKLLFTDPHWCSSGFSELESFLFSFLDGSTDTGMERMRIKLETPIAIADRLLVASENLVKQEYELACKDLSSINELVSSVKEYAMRMEYESSSWKRQALLLVEAAKTRTIKLIASILQPSNIDLITTYIFRGDKSSSVSVTASIQNDIISPALSDAQKLLGEYLQWLESSATQECNLYSELFEKRGPGFIRVNNQAHSETNGFLQKDKLSLQVTQSFSASAAARLFEQEIHEVALVTYGGLGAAGLSASLLTSVLPTTLEDLLALGFCSAGGLLAISNFPARRKRAIDKVNRVADGLAQQIEEAMQEDLAKTTEKLEKFVKHISEPYLEAAQHKIDHLSQIQKEVTEVAQKLRVLKTRIQNLHGS